MLSTLTKHGDACVVAITGKRLDAARAETFKSELVQIIDTGERNLVLDFAEIEFMDSSGLGALVGCLKHMGAGGQISIARPSESVQKVLRLTRMNKVFSVSETLPG